MLNFGEGIFIITVGTLGIVQKKMMFLVIQLNSFFVGSLLFTPPQEIHAKEPETDGLRKNGNLLFQIHPQF